MVENNIGDHSENELPLLTFKSLYSILREEKRSKDLQSFPPLFYESLKIFIKNLQEEVDNFSGSEDDLKRKKKILKNVIDISKDLFFQRTKKISSIALTNTLMDEDILDISNILDFERDFYDSICQSIKKFRGLI